MAPRTKEAVEIIRKEKMQVIEKAAIEVFAENGYHASSISLIAARAGISKGLIYNYYSSKEDLLKKVVFTTLEEMFQVFEFTGSMENLDFESVMHKMIDDGFDWVVQNRDFLKIYFGMILQPSVLSVVEKEMWEMAVPYFEKASIIFAAGGSDDPLGEIRYFNSMLDGIFLNYVLDPDSFPLQKIKQKVKDQYTKK